MNSSTIGSDWVGRIIDGRFSLLQWLGSSGWGGVFLTELDGDPARKAAIKLIPADEGAAEARIRGWAAATNLSHAHLMRIFHTGSCRIDDALLLYAVMEFAEENLSQVLPERPLTPIETREMLEPMLDALDYLHQNGFVHGHLKPSNILVVDNQLRISSENLQRAGAPVGTSVSPGACDAPESAAGPISPAADVWSLGVLLVEALTQHPPVWERTAKQEPVVPESIPEPFAAIARDCFRADPEQRCTIGEIKTRLDSARSFSAPAGKAAGPTPAKLRFASLAAAALVLFVVIAALLLRSHRNLPSEPVEEQRPAPAIATPPAQPSAPAAQRSKRAAAKGAVVEQAMPYASQGARNTIQGTLRVSIRVEVDPSGAVSEATVSSTGSKYFSNLALLAAQRWKFKPAQVDRRAVSSVWVLQFQFTQAETTVTPVEVSP